MDNPMNIIEIMRRRDSCRTYNGLRLDKSAITSLEDEIRVLPRLFEDVASPEIRVIDNDGAEGKLGTYGFITGARQFLAMASGKTRAEQVQAGFMFEALILKATGMGLATCWLGGTFRRGAFSEAFGTLGEGMEISIVSPVGHPTPKRRFAERMMRRMVKADRRKPFADLFRGVAEDTPIGRVLEAVRLAPSSSNSQPWRCTVSGGGDAGDGKEGQVTVEFSCAASGRFAPVDMGIAYCHFLLASRQEKLDWEIEDASNPLGLRFRSR